MFENVPQSRLKCVGTGVERIDTLEKLTGSALYCGDLILPGMLYGKIKRSPHAKARIKKINTARAEKFPGVHAVLTGEELENRVGLYLVDKFVMARGVVRHYGEAVAAVAAESWTIAQKACDLIDVEYEVMEPALDPVSAARKGAPLVHPDLGSYDYVKAVFTPIPGTNIANHTKLRKGDVEKGFKQADAIVEREYSNP